MPKSINTLLPSLTNYFHSNIVLGNPIAFASDDFSQFDVGPKSAGEDDALMYFLNSDSPLTSEQVDFLLKNCDLNYRNEDTDTALMLAFFHSSHEMLTKEQFEYLLDNSCIIQVSQYYGGALSKAVESAGCNYDKDTNKNPFENVDKYIWEKLISSAISLDNPNLSIEVRELCTQLYLAQNNDVIMDFFNYLNVEQKKVFYETAKKFGNKDYTDSIFPLLDKALLENQVATGNKEPSNTLKV